MTRVYRVLRAAYQARWRKWRAGKQTTAPTSGYTGEQGVQLTLTDRSAAGDDLHSGACHLAVHSSGCAELKLSLTEAARARAALKLMSCVLSVLNQQGSFYSDWYSRGTANRTEKAACHQRRCMLSCQERLQQLWKAPACRTAC